jgi:hypothetical protein
MASQFIQAIEKVKRKSTSWRRSLSPFREMGLFFGNVLQVGMRLRSGRWFKYEFASGLFIPTRAGAAGQALTGTQLNFTRLGDGDGELGPRHL